MLFRSDSIVPGSKKLIDFDLSDEEEGNTQLHRAVIAKNVKLVGDLCISGASLDIKNKKDTFSCKLEIEINNKRYFIERIGVKNKTGHVRVTVNFYTIDDAGQVVSLNGQERDDTNAIIRTYLGTYKDFILTSVIAQNNNTGFIEMSQKERKELLSQFLDINIFDELQKIKGIERTETFISLEESFNRNVQVSKD